MSFSQLKSQARCYGWAFMLFEVRMKGTKRCRRKREKKSNLVTKIRKFICANLIEAVKHVDLDLWKFPFGLHEEREMLIKLIWASPGDVKTRHKKRLGCMKNVNFALWKSENLSPCDWGLWRIDRKTWPRPHVDRLLAIYSNLDFMLDEK